MSVAQTKPAKRSLSVLPRQNHLEARAGEIIGMLAVGTPHSEIRDILGVGSAVLYAFKRRHQAEVDAAIARRNKRIEDYAIAQQVDRLEALNDRWLRGRELLAIRAADTRYDEPGYTTGLMVHNLKGVGTGDAAKVVDQYEVDTGLLAELRAIERAAAEELGQIKQPAKTEISDKRTYILQLVNGDVVDGDVPQLG
jgi:hypothetical protein